MFKLLAPDSVLTTLKGFVMLTQQFYVVNFCMTCRKNHFIVIEYKICRVKYQKISYRIVLIHKINFFDKILNSALKNLF